MVVPSGPESRLRDFPALEPSGKPIAFDGIDLWESSCEIVLSSAGFVTLTPRVGCFGKVRAWTPGGKGKEGWTRVVTTTRQAEMRRGAVL